MGKSSIKIGAVKVSGANTGAGAGLYSGSNPFNTLNFKSLVAAGGIDIITGATTITISGGSGGGGADGVVSGGTLTGAAILELGRTEGLGNVNIDLSALSGATASPAGLDRELQFNDSSSFGASSGLTYSTGGTLSTATDFAIVDLLKTGHREL